MSESFKSFEELECWKACRALRLFVAKQIVQSLPRDEKYRLGDQILRAARSATANIAEGYGRFHYMENAKFCSNAGGSCWEVLDHLLTAADEDLITPSQAGEGRELVNQSTKILSGYIHCLQKAAQRRTDLPVNSELDN